MLPKQYSRGRLIGYMFLFLWLTIFTIFFNVFRSSDTISIGRNFTIVQKGMVQNTIAAVAVSTTTHRNALTTITTHKIRNCSLSVCSIGNLGNQIWEYMSLFVVWQRFIDSGCHPYIEKGMLENLKALFSNLSIQNEYNNHEPCKADRRNVISKDEPLYKYAEWFNPDNGEIHDIHLDQYSCRYEEIIEYGIENITRELSFSRNLVEDCQGKLHELKQKFYPDGNVTFIGMHYRGTDYLNHLKIVYKNYNTIIPDHHYYVKAMNYFTKTYTQVIFILVTIDKKWLDKNYEVIRNNGNVVMNPYKNDRTHDLILLSHCNHSIINYGTFGATAALLAGGTTFAYNISLPLDHRGSTLALGIAQKLRKTWFLLS